jgi:hypothetical protein
MNHRLRVYRAPEEHKVKLFLKVYQIYFDDSQLPRLEYIPYRNSHCTVFFESSVIRTLIETNHHKDSHYFGVVSYSLRDKIDFLRRSRNNHPNIVDKNVTEFRPDLFEAQLKQTTPDVMSIQRHMSHDSVSFADKYHPNFSLYFKEIMSKIGYDWVPTRFNHVFYCNYFVAKSEIYERYVKEMLAPAMDVMKTMPELMNNSHYPKPLPDNLKQSFGVDYYPYHSFLCERMFSYFAHIHNLRCLHY